ncbi:MAG TPA: hypothetical protein VNH83_12680, partial [Bryobacteraceae bacterium]|nr:hypothetical protein [Bryobacteraceae bacterium]
MKKLILLTLLTAAMAVIRLPLAAQTQQSCKSYTLSTATAGTFIQIWPNNPPDNWSAGSMSASYLPTGTVSTISVSIAVGTVSAATTSNTFLKSMSLTGTASTSTSATDMGTASDTRQFWFIYNPTFTGSGSVKVTVCFSPIAVARSGAGGGTGATGPTGPTGATGATGATGNNGTNAVAGSDTQVQFNDGGSFGASANLTFNKTSGLFGVPKLLSTSNLSNGAYIFRELRPYDYPSSPAWLESITANSSAGSTTPDHVYTAGWNLYNSGCVSSSFPGWGLSMERIWHPGGSGNAGIASITINAGGTGYTVGDYVVVVQGGSSQNGIMKVTSVSSGVVTGFNVYQAGAGYAVANGLATLPATQANSGRYNLQTGSGTGLTFDIAAIGAPTDGGLESYFAYCNAGGGYGSRPLNFEVNFATNQAAVSFLANSVIFLTEDNLAGASFNTTRGVLNSGKLTISGSAAIGGIALDVSGNSSMSGNLTVSGETTTAASSTSNAGLRLSEGVAPTSPLVGDMWLDTS